MPGIHHFGAFQFARRRDGHKLGRHFENALLGLRLAGLPASAAQAIKLAFGFFRAIARDEVDILNRQENRVAAGIFQLQTVVRRAGDVQRLQADITPHTMVDVHDKIARIQRCCVGDEMRRLPLAARGGQTVAQNVRFGNDGEVCADEAGLQRNFDNRGFCLPGRFKRVNVDKIVQAVIGKNIDQTIRRACRPRREHNMMPGRPQRLCMRNRRFENVPLTEHPLRREVAAAANFHVIMAGRGFRWAETRNGMAVQTLLQL